MSPGSECHEYSSKRFSSGCGYIMRSRSCVGPRAVRSSFTVSTRCPSWPAAARTDPAHNSHLTCAASHRARQWKTTFHEKLHIYPSCATSSWALP